MYAFLSLTADYHPSLSLTDCYLVTFVTYHIYTVAIEQHVAIDCIIYQFR